MDLEMGFFWGLGLWFAGINMDLEMGFFWGLGLWFAGINMDLEMGGGGEGVGCGVGGLGCVGVAGGGAS